MNKAYKIVVVLVGGVTTLFIATRGKKKIYSVAEKHAMNEAMAAVERAAEAKKKAEAATEKADLLKQKAREAALEAEILVQKTAKTSQATQE